MKGLNKMSIVKGGADKELQVDSMDRQIIGFLVEDGRMPFAKIAKSIGVSVGTVRARVCRMVKEEIIYPSVGVDERKLGYTVQSVIRIQVDLKMVRQVAQQLASLAPVRYIATVSGEYDLMVFVFFHSQDEVMDFVSEQIGAIEGIRRAEVFPVFQLTKVNLDKMLL